MYDVRNAIGTALETGWNALALNPALPLVWGNEEFRPDLHPVARIHGFVQADIAFGAALPLEIGNYANLGGAWRQLGFVFGTTFTPIGTGETESWRRAGYFENILRPTRPLSIVRWVAFDKQAAGQNGDFFSVQVSCRFEYEYTST